MKKSIVALITAVAIVFVGAIGLCVRALNAPQAVFSGEDAGMKIVIDAGHGGIDGGVTGKTTKVKESDLNLSIAFKLKEVLEDFGFETVLTRKTEAGLYDTTAKGFKRRDMEKRKEIIVKSEPALVISVHQNFYPSSSSRGAQVFFSKANEGSRAFAKTLQNKLNGLYATEKVKGRNASAGEYFMLECCDAPSVIVECGFLSNSKDESLLKTESWQKRIAEAIGAGVLAYFSESTS